MSGETGSSDDAVVPRTGFSLEAVSQIVEATGVPLKGGVQPDRLRVVLDRLVTEVTVMSLSRDPRGGRKDLQRLKRAFETYKELADVLPAYDLYPPKPPEDWGAAVTLWIKNMEAELKAMKGQVRSRAMSAFYPRAIGLFAAAFDIEVTVWHDDNSASAPLVKFAEAVIVAARHTVDISSLAGPARIKADEPQNPWILPVRSTIRVGLQTAKKKMPDRGPGPLGAEGYEGPLQLAWKAHQTQFVQLLGLKENE